jgi:hypothetical protein
MTTTQSLTEQNRELVVKQYEAVQVTEVRPYYWDTQELNKALG